MAQMDRQTPPALLRHALSGGGLSGGDFAREGTIALIGSIMTDVVLDDLKGTVISEIAIQLSASTRRIQSSVAEVITVPSLKSIWS